MLSGGNKLVLLSLLQCLACFHNAWAITVGESQDKLLDDLFRNYTPWIRPLCGQNDAVQVKIDLAVRQIVELDEPKQILYLNAWIRLSWDDCNLNWNPDNYSGLTGIVVPFERAWSPDITLYDNGDAELEGSKEYLIYVGSNGACSYNYPTIIKVLCKIDVVYFPFDTQVCPLKFGSWSYNGFEINVTNRDPDGDMDSFVPNTEWDLLRLPLSRHVLYYGCCPEPYPDVTFYVTMKRKPLFYVLNLLFPCLLITAVALLGFILPPDAGEKVSLEITVLLSLAVFLLVVSETLPATSEGFPYIGIYFAVAMLLVSLSTLLTVLVLNVHHKGNLNKPVPEWVRSFVLKFLGKLVGVQSDRAIHPFKPKPPRPEGEGRRLRETFINGYQEYQRKEQAHCNGNGTVGAPKPHQVGNLFHNHSHNHNHRKPGQNGPDIMDRPLGSEFMQPSTTNVLPLRSASPAFSRGESPRRENTAVGGDMSINLPMSTESDLRNPTLEVLREQLRVLELEQLRYVGKSKHDHLTNEWKRVAVVLDRVFLALFLFIMIVSSLAILLQLST